MSGSLDRLGAHLLYRIHRRFPTVTETVRIGRLSIPFTRIAEPDRVLDAVAAEEERRSRGGSVKGDIEPLVLPYWAELWESATGVGQWLFGGIADRGVDPQSAIPNVLDLGCGMGLSGTVAAALGARVLFADIEPLALLFARLNSLPWQQRVRARRLNWQRDMLDERFDVIIGADILYERAQWDYLEPFWRMHLADGGTVVLGEPGRQTGEAFVPWIAERGWSLCEYAEPVAGRSRPIRVLTLQRAIRQDDELPREHGEHRPDDGARQAIGHRPHLHRQLEEH